jgi:TIR domain-containing protein
VNAQDSKAEIFDVFLCHNSEDKPAVREIAQKLSQKNIKAWLDEADIKAGSFWHSAIGQQIETVKSAAVFIGQYGVGPWQNREIIALLDQFDRRGCPVIPAILASAPAKAALALVTCGAPLHRFPRDGFAPVEATGLGHHRRKARGTRSSPRFGETGHHAGRG